MRHSFLIPNRNSIWKLDWDFRKLHVPAKLAVLITYPYFTLRCQFSLCQSTYHLMLPIHFGAWNTGRLCFRVKTCPSFWNPYLMLVVFMTTHLAFILIQFHFSNRRLLRDVKRWGRESPLKKVNIERKSKHFVMHVSDWKRPVSVSWFQHCLDNFIGLHSCCFSCILPIFWVSCCIAIECALS